MAKYIDKMALPQFKYYNLCEGDDYAWDIRGDNTVHIRYKKDDLTEMTFDIDEEAAKNFNIYEAGVDLGRFMDTTGKSEEEKDDIYDELCEKWITSYMDDDTQSASGRIYQLIIFLLHAMFKDENLVEIWRQRLEQYLENEEPEDVEMIKLLSLICEIIDIAIMLRKAQGYPVSYVEGPRFPKMVLIEDVLYKKTKGSKDIKLDYRFLRDAVMDNEYVVTINGDSSEKKMVFVISNKAQSECISIEMLDQKNGVSTFVLRLAEKENALMDKWNHEHAKNPVERSDSMLLMGGSCHPRGDYDCGTKEENRCTYCHGEHTCKHRSMEIAATVLFLFQEYMRKLENEEKITPSVKEGSRAAAKTRVESYVPEGMMRMYDIKVSEDLQRVDKFRLFSKKSSQYPSTEKCAHVRKGTMRYNPKTGQ
jgi:hypothetical protein